MTELGQDWGMLNRILYPRRKAKGASTSKTVFIAHHSSVTLRVVGDRDDLLFTTGSPLDEALTAVGGDYKPVSCDIAEMDRVLGRALAIDGGIYEQVLGMRDDLVPTRGKLPAWKEHFLFSTVRTWWGKFLPSSFGLYLNLEGAGSVESTTLLLIFRKGELAEFDEPDLSAISQERRADLGEVVKVLRARHGIPVQGFAMNRADFDEWSEMGDSNATWKNVSRALRQERLTLYPFRFSVAALVGSRGIFGF